MIRMTKMMMRMKLDLQCSSEQNSHGLLFSSLEWLLYRHQECHLETLLVSGTHMR